MFWKPLISALLLAVPCLAHPGVAAKKPLPESIVFKGFTWSRTRDSKVPSYCRPPANRDGSKPTHTYVDLSRQCQQESILGTSCLTLVDGFHGVPMTVAGVEDLMQVLDLHVNKTMADARTVGDGTWEARFEHLERGPRPPKVLVDTWEQVIDVLKAEPKGTGNILRAVFNWESPLGSYKIVVDRLHS